MNRSELFLRQINKEVWEKILLSERALRRLEHEYKISNKCYVHGTAAYVQINKDCHISSIRNWLPGCKSIIFLYLVRIAIMKHLKHTKRRKCDPRTITTLLRLLSTSVKAQIWRYNYQSFKRSLAHLHESTRRKWIYNFSYEASTLIIITYRGHN